MKCLKPFTMGACALLLMGVSCIKDPPERPLIKLDEDFLSYFAFPVGSYWIYEEERSGKLDSAYIIVYEKYEELTSDRPRDKIERLTLHEVIRGDTIYGNASPFRFGENTFHYYYSQILKTNNLGGSVFVKYSDISFDSAANSNRIPLSTITDSMTLNGMTFSHIITFHYSTDQRLPYQSISYVKDVGVIRREYTDGTTWNLVRYHHSQ